MYVCMYVCIIRKKNLNHILPGFLHSVTSLEWDIPKVMKIVENDNFESVWTSCKMENFKTNVSACPMPKAGTGSACFWECPHSWDVTLHKIQL
jgi:hypothetical protein